MRLILLFSILVVFVFAAATAPAQSSHPPLEGGVTPPSVTVTSNQVFYAGLWSRDFDSDELGTIFCNNLTTVTVKSLQSGTTVYFAHTSLRYAFTSATS